MVSDFQINFSQRASIDLELGQTGNFKTPRTLNKFIQDRIV